MVLAVIFVIVGLALLMFGADRFVDGAAALAQNFGIPPLLIGLTVVGFATSAPELLVAATASLNGNPSLAIGNAIGSNVANIGLVLGISVLVMPLVVIPRVLVQELPIMFVAMIGASLLFLDGHLDRSDGIYLALGLVVMMGVTTWLGMRGRDSNAADSNPIEHDIKSMTTVRALVLIAIGLVCLIAGSDRLVAGAVTIAKNFGVSDLIIGLTIVAIGTSLPELAASVASALKGQSEIALGNVIGSNMFNILGVTAAPALIVSTTIDQDVLNRDLPVMFAISIVLYLMAFGRKGRITRFEGGCLFAGFIAYQYVLYLSTTG